IVVLIGTEADPQGLSRQRAAFEAAGARVFLSNSRAARSLVQGGAGPPFRNPPSVADVGGAFGASLRGDL
ncbi:MAG TPA: hypothetical protein VKF59_13080, partial [Candidatus Dormibacteraeota bacterium]|nr:hypothetical protein [Candidatus Dormibacteraeota bacterium]